MRLDWDHIIQRGRGAAQAILESSAVMENDEDCNHVYTLILRCHILIFSQISEHFLASCNELKLPAKCFLMN